MVESVETALVTTRQAQHQLHSSCLFISLPPHPSPSQNPPRLTHSTLLLGALQRLADQPLEAAQHRVANGAHPLQHALPNIADGPLGLRLVRLPPGGPAANNRQEIVLGSGLHQVQFKPEMGLLASACSGQSPRTTFLQALQL